jgi:hypothetical protein
MTNADKIRSMTDEQLAEWLGTFDMDICENCAMENKPYCEKAMCTKQWQKWVKQEHVESNATLTQL